MPIECVIRAAGAADVGAIHAIYNQVIATSTAIYWSAPASLQERTAWVDARVAAGFPVLVAEREDAVLGFASFGEFRGPSGYRYSVEHTVHVHADCRGQGVGPRLVAALFPFATALGKHVMIGGIDAANAASLRMHARLGFEEVAHFREVGHKFGRWLDLVFMQRFLDAPGSARAAGSVA
jgi:phosphinothricin acetyltransferase